MMFRKSVADILYIIEGHTNFNRKLMKALGGCRSPIIYFWALKLVYFNVKRFCRLNMIIAVGHNLS